MHEIDTALAVLEGLRGDDGVSLATVVQHRGRIVAEAYGPDVDADTTLISWSMAKSVVQALLGICVDRGLIDLDEPAPVDEWRNDERQAITIRQLLQMRSGLAWNEDYLDAQVSDVIEMLFGSGADDVAAYAAAKPLEHAPGSTWLYSSGTTNILARIVGTLVGGTQSSMHEFMSEALFDPLGMSSATPKFDTAGTFIGSSFLYATARDFAKFGELYRLGGIGPTGRLISQAMVNVAFEPVPVVLPPDERFGYGGHWWSWDRQGLPTTFGAHGYEQQRILVDVPRELVVVQLSKVDAEHGPAVDAQLVRIVNAFESR